MQGRRWQTGDLLLVSLQHDRLGDMEPGHQVRVHAAKGQAFGKTMSFVTHT